MTSQTMRRYGSLIVATAITGVLLPLPLALQHTALADGSQQASQNISSSSDQSEAPSIATGGGGLAITWGERENSTVKVAGANIDGNFGESGSFKSGTNTQFQWADIAMDGGGTKHLAYASGDTIYYRNKTAGGSWSGSRKVASDSFPNPVRMAVAPNGTIWVIWRDTDGSRIRFRYSTDGGSNWSGSTIASDSGNMYMFDIAVGSDNIPHAVWYVRSSGSYKGEIRYGDWNGSGFTTGRVTSDGSTLYDADPVIAVDGNNVQHLSWRKQLNDTGTKWAIMYARRNTGSGWSDFTTLATTNGDAKYSPGIGTDKNGSIYVGYSDPTSSSRRHIALLSKPSNSANWSNQAVSDSRWDYRPAIVGTTDTGIEAHIAYQKEDKADEAEIRYLRYSFGSATPTATPIPPVNADITINNGAEITNSNSVIVTFQNVTGNPTQVRWKWGSAPTDASTDSGGWVAYNSTMTVSLPSNASTCTDLILYAQAKSDASTDSTPGVDAIKYDNAVQARAAAVNPNMAYGTSTYNLGATSGDTGFTRSNNIAVRIEDVGDCAGLKSYSVNGNAATNWTTGATQATTTVNVDTTAEGQKSVPIVVTDNQGNNLSNTPSYYYDKTAPAVRSLGTLALPSGDGILQRLNFSGVDVTDTLYSSATGKPFWGVWVASSKVYHSTDTAINASDMQWTVVRVPNPGATFSVEYSLASGRSIADLAGPNPNYIYVKFLDGAGNPSAETLVSEPLTITNTALLETSLPNISK
ncbi:hypothetical protein F8S13_20205 [Chloroflexia bacterium SDU3-3]|nr:hypothetical protein F8S13_20205 [Chloroflexia bacterium SDU3-3]